MLKNYLKVAVRNLLRYKAYSFINLLGLALGLACFVLITLYVVDERSFDSYHGKSDRIARIGLELSTRDGVQNTAQSPPKWTTLMMEQFPEIESAVRLKPPRQSWMVNYRDRRFNEKGWYFADSSVFDVFDIPLIQGDPSSALTAPSKVVISQPVAEKYYRDENPIGKTITIDSQYEFEVVGIMEPFPSNSHIHPDFLASFVSMEDPNSLYLFNVLEAQFPFSYTYLLLNDRDDARSLSAKFPAFIEQNVPPQFRQGGNEVRMFLQPLESIHLESNLENEIEPNGNAAIVNIFLAVAIFLLLIACVNFMNLSTARSAKRAKEVGMRKVVGASRSFLVQQFLGESILLAVVALVGAMLMAMAALSPFNSLTQKTITLAALFDPKIVGILIAATIGVGLVSGSYPAFFLSSFRPSAVLKGETGTRSGGQAWLRKSLIVFQFAVSLVLIIGTGIVYKQMRFINNKPLGFDKEQVIVIQVTDPEPSRLFTSYRNAILRDPNVISVSSSMAIPSGPIQPVLMQLPGWAEDENISLQFFQTHFDYAQTLGLEILAGRDFSRDFPSDTLGGVVINETAMRAFGWQSPEDAVGQELEFTGNANTAIIPRVIGVVRDFHTQSVHEKIAPTVLVYNSFRFFGLVRVNTTDVTGTIASLESTWESMVPGYSFEYSFLDDDFEQLYRSEAVLGKLLGFFAGLTVFIACLGLLGLASFTAERRTKEIGVRKVLGASVSNIVLLLSREFTVLVLLAFIVAVPIAYYAMNRWLSEFAYHTRIGLAIFIIAGIGALAISWLTVSYQAVKAALADPVKSIRYE